MDGFTLAEMLRPEWWTGEKMAVGFICIYLVVSMLRTEWRD